MSEVIPKVTETDQSKTISVPFLPGKAAEVKLQTEECMNKFCELVAHEFSLDLNDVKNCIPKDIVYTEREPMKRGRKLSTIDWEKAASKDELSSMTSASLKDVLSSRGMRTSGPKVNLIARVWGLINSDEAPKESPLKKRGRKPGSKNKKTTTIIDDSDNESSVNLSNSGVLQENSNEDIMSLLANGSADRENMKLSDGIEYVFIKSKAWLFLEDSDGDLEWAGILNGNSCLSDDPPQILIDLYNE